MMNIIGMCVATFVFKPAMQAIGPTLGFSLEYDEAFFNARIDAITETVCDGIIIKETLS
jgi:hypothetical protein